MVDLGCPIEGASGAGSEVSPVVVDTFAELKEALRYKGDLHILVENGTYIECTDTVTPLDTKTLTVNGTLHGEKTIVHSWGYDKVLVLRGNGTIHSEKGYAIKHNNSSYASMAETTIQGNLTFISDESDAVHAYASRLIIEGGTFRTNSEGKSSLYLLEENGYAAVANLAGGSFPNGINIDKRVALKEGYAYQYADGTLSYTLQKNVPVDVVNPNYDFGLGFYQCD